MPLLSETGFHTNPPEGPEPLPEEEEELPEEEDEEEVDLGAADELDELVAAGAGAAAAALASRAARSLEVVPASRLQLAARAAESRRGRIQSFFMAVFPGAGWGMNRPFAMGRSGIGKPLQAQLV